MAARITRAKKKIAAARIPYRVPAAPELPARTAAVLSVVHLVFSTGHTAPAGERLVRRDLVERALDLARMLYALLPGDPEVAGLLALLLLTDARSPAREVDGELALLADQERSRWNRDAIGEGLALLAPPDGAPAGRFALMAQIAAAHARAPAAADTPWEAIVALYDRLLAVWPSPVVALNRAAALGLARGPAAGLRELDALGSEPALATYGYLAAARADFLARLGRASEARDAYEEAPPPDRERGRAALPRRPPRRAPALAAARQRHRDPSAREEALELGRREPHAGPARRVVEAQRPRARIGVVDEHEMAAATLGRRRERADLGAHRGEHDLLARRHAEQLIQRERRCDPRPQAELRRRERDEARVDQRPGQLVGAAAVAAVAGAALAQLLDPGRPLAARGEDHLQARHAAAAARPARVARVALRAVGDRLAAGYAANSAGSRPRRETPSSSAAAETAAATFAATSRLNTLGTM